MKIRESDGLGKREEPPMDFSEYNEVVRAWIDEVLRNRGINAELTLKFCQDIEQYAAANRDDKLLGFAYYYSGETYYVLNDGENMFRSISRAISCLDRSGQWELAAKAYNIMAITSVSRGNAPIAMDYYLTGLNYCRKYKLYQEENIIRLNLGNLYLSVGQPAEAQIYFEKAKSYVRCVEKAEDYYSLLNCIYINLGRCYLLQGKTEQAQSCIELADRECLEHLQKVEKLFALCFKARYYHVTGRITMRDACIREIQENVDTDMAVMDIFDDFYELCELLLETEHENVLWEIVEILEGLSRRAGILNLQRRIISLKIKYYRMHEQHEAYLQASGLYYEMTGIMERENQYMIASMLEIRRSLEQANEKRQEMEEANERLLVKSETDALTHLANRFRLNDYSEHAFEQAQKSGMPLAVEILDIDYFKEYNDTYGHQQGDECIIRIAGVLRQMENDKIFCARYGGDEFIIIYESMSKDEVSGEAEKLRQHILDLEMEHLCSRALPVVTISQGICYDIPGPENKIWDFLHAADMMLYHVKEQARNNISIGRLEPLEKIEG